MSVAGETKNHKRGMSMLYSKAEVCRSDNHNHTPMMCTCAWLSEMPGVESTSISCLVSAAVVVVGASRSG